MAGSWSLVPNLGLTGSTFDPLGLPSGAYVVTFTLSTSPGPTCDLTYSNTILVRRQPIVETKTAIAPCSVDTGNGPTTTNLFDWLESGFSLGDWVQTGGTPILPIVNGGVGISTVDFAGQP